LRARCLPKRARLRAVPDRPTRGPAARRRARRVQRRWPPVGATAFPYQGSVCAGCAKAMRRSSGRPPRRRRANCGVPAASGSSETQCHDVSTTRTLLALSLAPRAARPCGPWQRTEAREPCASFELFGSRTSATRTCTTPTRRTRSSPARRENPRGAYRFAEGEPSAPTVRRGGHADAHGAAPAAARFTAVTDHAEQFGESQICLTPGLSRLRLGRVRRGSRSAGRPAAGAPEPVAAPAVITFPSATACDPSATFSWCGPTARTASRGVPRLQTPRPRPRSSTTAPRPAPSRPSRPTSGAVSRRPTTCTATSSSGTPSCRPCRRATWSSRRRQGLWATLQSQCVDGSRLRRVAIPHNPTRAAA